MSESGTLLLPEFLLPIRPSQAVLTHQAVRVVGQVIDNVMPAEEARLRYPSDDLLVLDDCALMPGLINMHTHSPMSLLRGFADDMSLNQWLQEHIWPAEARWVSEEFVRDGVALAMAEMIRGGVTCFNEMYFFPETMIDAVESAGMRAAIGMPVIDVETPWAGGVSDCLRLAKRVIERLDGHATIQAMLAPHAGYTVDDAGLSSVARLASESNVPVNMHLLEIAWEIEHCHRHYGESPIERLERLGLLGEDFIGVHMVHLQDEEIARIAKHGVHVVHCPESNLKLASGICPVTKMLDAGVNVSLGTDGAASNNNLNLIGEARTAALLAKGTTGNPETLDAWQVLDMMTINGARALGQGDQLGSIEPGKQADLCAINLRAPETQPLHSIQSQLVYSASSRQVSDVWVAGRRILANQELTTLDLDRIMDRAGNWNDRLRTGAQESE